MQLCRMVATVVLVAICSGIAAKANTITFSTDFRPVTAAEAAGGAPKRGLVFRYKVTTDGDIRNLESPWLDLGPGTLLYNHPFGTEYQAGPPLPTLIDLFPALNADSWVDTPGKTELLSGAEFPGDGTLTPYVDTTDDGPQQEFVFAQFTLYPASEQTTKAYFSFSGGIRIEGTDGGPATYSQAFNYLTGLEGIDFPVPEPSSGLLLAAGSVGVILKRRIRSLSL